MIKKIKRYKINLRPSYAFRHLKRKVGSEMPVEELEKSIEQEIPKVEPLVATSAVYDSFSKIESPEPLKPLWKDAPKGALSISIAASTVGQEFEKAIEASHGKNEGFKTALLDSIAREALEQAGTFVEKLLIEEAKLENCECTPSLPAHPEVLKDCLDLLQAHKADITLDGTGRIVPLFSHVRYCFWTPAPKK